MAKLASYQRNFNWFLNLRGVAQNTSEFFATEQQADEIINLHADRLGQWSVYNQGFERFSTVIESGAPVQSIATFRNAAGSTFMAALSNGKIKNISTADGSILGDIKTGLGTTTKMDAAAYRGSLFLTEETMTPQKWSGSGASSDATGWPVTVGLDSYNQPKIVEAYNSRLCFANFQAGVKFPSHVILSDILSPETFDVSGTDATDGVVVQVAPGDGQEVRALKSLYIPAQQEEILLVGKDSSLYSISGYSKADIQVQLVNATTGVLNNRCMVQIGNDVVYLDKNNVYSMSTALQSGTLQPRAIGSSNVKETLALLNLTASENAWAIHHPTRKEVWFAIPTGSSTYPNKILVYRYDEDGQDAVMAWSIRDYHTALCGDILDNVFYTGGNDGYINKWFVASQYAGSGISWAYEWPWLSFNSQGQLKRILELYVWFIVRADDTFTFRTDWRGGGNETSKNFSIPVSVSSAGSVYGSSAPPAGVYGTAFYGQGAILRCVKVPVYGHGLQFKLRVSGTTGANGPTLLGASGIVEYMGFNRKYI